MKKLAFIFAMLTFLPFIARAENVLNETDALRRYLPLAALLLLKRNRA